MRSSQPHTTPTTEAEPTGYRLAEALAAAGIPSHRQTHAGTGCEWLAVGLEDGSEIWISNLDSDADFDPATHSGWIAHHHYNPEDGRFLPVYEGTGAHGFTTDTAAAVDAIRRFWARRRGHRTVHMDNSQYLVADSTIGGRLYRITIRRAAPYGDEPRVRVARHNADDTWTTVHDFR